MELPMIPDTEWQAVLARDPRFDGRFVYAVRSTGIYCRPSCASRRPDRRYVRMFRAPDAAERAGYRPCRRCRPKAANGRPAIEKVRLACEAIATRAGERLTLAALAREMGMSPSHFQRTFTGIVGISPRRYADACRVDRLKTRLREGSEVTDALYDAGYGSSSRLYESANRRIGMTPATYRRGGRGARIGFTVVPSRFGRVLIAATERGICALSLGDGVRKLETWLREEYPSAEIVRDDRGLRAHAQALADHLTGRQPDIDLPLDVRASAFQRRVWDELQRIPYGQTRSYGEVAVALGKPTAARAVARACATNLVSIVIPCHRVVRSSGHLGGYRWGMDRKRAILEQEAAIAGRAAQDDRRIPPAKKRRFTTESS
ncbi:MAG: bifunctional DNA-binding transcriptional regulator/O6-methylguanine-DNA methyltransferase Ada [Acidobacteria bacterium]|nr:bifunctional DNA-binding transcriptional regulator/O6-methylguanine-DNA methyltransferase Ada [Acidobacteriota bacterium]